MGESRRGLSGPAAANTMKRLTLSQQIGAVGLFVLLTVAVVPTYFVNRGFLQDLDFAALERQGIQYQRPLVELLQNLSEHELLSRLYLAGRGDLQGQAVATAGKVDAAMEALRGINVRLGTALQFTPEGLAKRKREHYRWEILNQEWSTLKSGIASQSPADSDKLHSHLIADVRAMIAHAGDTSNLILDSDLDSYYLMDAVVVALPQTQDRLTTIEMLAQDLAASGKSSGSQQTQLAVAAAQLKESDLDHIAGDIQTSLNEDQNFHGTSRTLQSNLPPATQEYSKANEGLLDLMGKSAASPGASIPAEFAADASAARRASFQLWQTGAQELDVLLEMRIHDIAVTRVWALALTALAIVVSAGIAALAIRSTTRRLRSASERILRHSLGIRSASAQIASSSRELARAASEQAASLEETSASSEEISSMVRKSSESSRAAAELVTRSQSRFADANRSLDGMVAAINEISAESDKISKIIKTIDEIAFQTNILALNAAVEAARAGESGMGFAVVADEVRNLAQRSAQAARDTAGLIEGSIAKSRDGKGKVDHVATAIHAITGESAKIKVLVDDVSVSTREQTQGIEQVAKAITLMEHLTQRNAAGAEEGASAAAELQGQSQALQEIVEELTALAGGSQHPSSRR